MGEKTDISHSLRADLTCTTAPGEGAGGRGGAGAGLGTPGRPEF